jgi:hypothetical protein
MVALLAGSRSAHAAQTDVVATKLDCGGIKAGEDGVALCYRLASMLAVLNEKLDQVRTILDVPSNTTFPVISAATPTNVPLGWIVWIVWVIVSYVTLVRHL